MRGFALLLLLLAGCAPSLPACPVGAPGVTAQLFFGRAGIDEAAWQGFLTETITPRFPDGLTVIDAYGQWRQRATGRVIRETASVLEIATDEAALPRLEEIRAAYRARFHQESVGLVITRNCASF